MLEAVVQGPVELKGGLIFFSLKNFLETSSLMLLGCLCDVIGVR